MYQINIYLLSIALTILTCDALKITKLTAASTFLLNVGPQLKLPGTLSVQHSNSLTFPKLTAGADPTGTIDSHISNSLFKTSRQGSSFSITLPVKPGVYDLYLGFTPPKGCVVGRDVFHVLHGTSHLLSSYDITKETASCKTPIVETFSWKLFTSNPLSRTFSFRSVSGVASLSFILVLAPTAKCTKVQMLNAPAHLAHSVPGKYPSSGGSYIDYLGKGYRKIYLNGLQSHSHLPLKGRNARITSFTWSLYPSGRVISRKVVFPYIFSLGTTRLSLSVVDEACDTSTDVTSVSVSTTVQSGAYCYFYEAMAKLPAGGTLGNLPKPIFAVKSPTSLFSFRSLQGQHKILNREFIARCVFFIDFQKNIENAVLSINTIGTGVAKLYRDNGLIINSYKSKSEPLEFSSGLSSFELIYHRKLLSSKPVLELKVNNRFPKLIFDNSAIQPIISSVSPGIASLTGGNEIMIAGYGLYWPLTIKFGKTAVRPEWKGSSPTRVYVRTPKFNSERVVSITIETKPGIFSNSVPFNVTGKCNALSFKKTYLTMANTGKPPPVKLATSAALGNDGRLYIGSAGGKLYALSYNAQTLSVTNMCSSAKLTDSRYRMPNGKLSPRSILGVTFDPRDKIPRPYVSVSTLLWSYQIEDRNQKRWSNGVISRLRLTPEKNGICMSFDKNIVMNLPVSPRDHAVNEILFNQAGDMLISLGGHTNAGLPSTKMGNVWETYFSGSVIIAKLSSKNFNGNIPYQNPTNSKLAKPFKGYTDVAFYATGLRNLFSLQMKRNGEIYGVDMGTNCGTGDVASACSENSNSRNQKGQVVVDKNSAICPKSPSRVDKVINVKRGKYYGHPNIQRGLLDGKQHECQWIDPKTNLAPGGPMLSKKNYERPVRMIYSAKTGILEYGSKIFCQELRGDLIFSQYSELGSWRLRFREKGNVEGDPYEFIKGYSGIRIIENVHGDLFFPRYKNQGIYVAKAQTWRKFGLFIGNALPFRHGRNGGTRLHIGGWGFAKGLKVFVGKGECKLLKFSTVEILCIVPKQHGMQLSVDVRVQLGQQQSTLKKGVLYMEV